MSVSTEITRTHGALDVWAAGIGVGLRSMRREPLLGMKRLLLPANYWRTAEFAYAWEHLRLAPGATVLDLGSPKTLAFILARHARAHVVATDIQETEVDLSRRYARAQGIDGAGSGRVQSEVQDGRRLSYADGAFDAAYSISVLEHIPGAGDTEALVELVRVVKPGGRIVLTVPFAPSYSEMFVARSVYERRQAGTEPVFYQRYYDESMLAERLERPSGTLVTDRTLWGEGRVAVEEFLAWLGRFRAPLSPLEPLLSRAFLRPVQPPGAGRPMAAFLCLQRPN